MTQAYQLTPGPIFKAERPVRNPQYLRFVKRFGCVACGSTRDVDPAHTGGHGLGSKASDMLVIPLCRPCHRAFDADPKRFARGHGLNIKKLILQLNRQWKRRT